MVAVFTVTGSTMTCTAWVSTSIWMVFATKASLATTRKKATESTTGPMVASMRVIGIKENNMGLEFILTPRKRLQSMDFGNSVNAESGLKQQALSR